MPNGLKNIRERAGLTQAEAASLMHLSKSGYVKVETGDRRLSQRHIQAAMRAFSATERDILGYDNSQITTEAEPQTKRDLSPAEAQAFARACMIFLEENADGELATQWLEALLEAVQQRGNDAELHNLEILRAKVRTVATLARAGLLFRNPQKT